LKPYCENQTDADILRDYATPLNLIACPDDLMLWYQYFLNEGDFEHWQKYCYMEECKEKRRERLRAMWIAQRFNLFGSYEWTEFTKNIHPLFETVRSES